MKQLINDEWIEKIAAINLKKLILYSILLLIFEYIYCGTWPYEVSLELIFGYPITFLVAHFLTLQAKLNIFTGANETLLKGWLRYSVLLASVPFFIIGVVFFVMLILTREISLSIVLFMAPFFLYFSCRAIVMYKEEDKTPPKWKW